MSENSFSIELVKGNIAPRYSPEICDRKLQLDRVVITENGTEGNLPIVDFVCKDPDGKYYFFAITGRLVNMVSAAIKGVNYRNHGVEEP